MTEAISAATLAGAAECAEAAVAAAARAECNGRTSGRDGRFDFRCNYKQFVFLSISMGQIYSVYHGTLAERA